MLDTYNLPPFMDNHDYENIINDIPTVLTKTLTLQDLFNRIIKLGNKVRCRKLDSDLVWILVKEQYSNLYLSNHSTIALRPHFDILPTYDIKYNVQAFDLLHLNVILNIRGEILNNHFEHDHFIIQLFRIPRLANYQLTLLQLLQMAYNIGQIMICNTDGIYPKKIMDYIVHSAKLYQLSSYIGSEFTHMLVKSHE